MENKNLLPLNGEVNLKENFYETPEAEILFYELKNTCAWKQYHILLFGKQRILPRLCAWYGDMDKNYTYSGLENIPLPWNTVLSKIRQRIFDLSGTRFNSALLNYYRNGNDSMGWHSDNEKELGSNPLIVSLSFGVTRVFKFKHKKLNISVISMNLKGGSLIFMKGETQQYWLHSIPKSCKVSDERINITFRNIL